VRSPCFQEALVRSYLDLNSKWTGRSLAGAQQGSIRRNVRGIIRIYKHL
jgi:hypothetical protein